MATIKFDVKGVKSLMKKLEKHPELVSKWSHASLQKSTLDVRRLSALYTPVDTGNLRGSIRSSVKKRDKGTIVGSIWYIAEYAIYVHEKTWTRLKNGFHKFLARAVIESSTKVKKNLVAALKRAFSEASK